MRKATTTGSRQLTETIPLAEACARLGVSEPTLRSALREGRVPGGLRIGARRWVIAREPFQQWLAGPTADTIERIAEEFANCFTGRLVTALLGAFGHIDKGR